MHQLEWSLVDVGRCDHPDADANTKSKMEKSNGVSHLFVCFFFFQSKHER